MSEYGRLWQQVADIRAQLHILLPGTSLAKEWNTLTDARAAVVRRTNTIHDLLERWADLERQMTKTE